MTRPNQAQPGRLRIGIGHDTHRLSEGGPLILGGVSINHPMHLVGHSDADVLLHAITDALLGAGSLGDIGEWFPDTDPAHRGRDSKTMLREVVRQITSDGYRIDHLDCIVFAEAPKLTLHKASMRQAIGLLLQIPEESVSIKAKTGEGVDAVGEGRAISAQAIVLLSGISD